MPNFSLYSFLRNENHLFHLAQKAEARILESTFLCASQVPGSLDKKKGGRRCNLMLYK
jgi:hypothetical protein